MLELYYYENSVCSERVLMTLAEKGVDDWIGHHLDLFKGEEANFEYLKLNPKGQVPTLVHHGRVIRESSIICEYLDDLHADHPLKPDDKIELAHMREWVKEADEAGFQGVASLSFAAVFREKLSRKTEQDRARLWAGQTDLSRTYRQKSCFSDGLESPYAIIALAAWDGIFVALEKVLYDQRQWIIGDRFTLADLNFTPLIARLEAIGFLDIWLEHRPCLADWWRRLKARPSFAAANVGPGNREEQEDFAREGSKHLDQVRRILQEVSQDTASGFRRE